MRTKNVCRRCRREGVKLFLKGDRCLSPKCSFTRRSYVPGSSGTGRSAKLSDYAIQLREKQKAKSLYNLRENQFQNYYLKASKSKEASGEKILQMLETRLDNVVYHLGFANSLRSARQLVNHKKIKVNGKIVNIPSFSLREKMKIEPVVKTGFKIFKSEVPVWLKLDKANFCGEVVKVPMRSEISTDINEALIVEFYSR